MGSSVSDFTFILCVTTVKRWTTLVRPLLGLELFESSLQVEKQKLPLKSKEQY